MARTRRQSDDAVRKAAEQQLERKRYQAALAERQYNKVDPDNRLVASEPERRREAALMDVRAAEEALMLPAAVDDSPTPLDRGLRDNVIALAGRLPTLWDDPITGDARRKALLRCLVGKVVLERGVRDVSTVRIVWRGGAVSELAVARPVNGIAALTRGAKMQVRILDLARAGRQDDEIAVRLTPEGHRSPTGPDRARPTAVQRIRLAAGVKAATQRTRWRHQALLHAGVEPAERWRIARHRPWTCMDGSRWARCLFGSDVWSVAAMYAASEMQRIGCAP